MLLNSHGNYIVDHVIVFLNFCGNPGIDIYAAIIVLQMILMMMMTMMIMIKMKKRTVAVKRKKRAPNPTTSDKINQEHISIMFL